MDNRDHMERPHREDRGERRHRDELRRGERDPHRRPRPEGDRPRPHFDDRGPRPHFEDRGPKSKGDRRPKHHKRFQDEFAKTKMFTSKEQLVEFVNSIGDQGHKIDIFKIEDDLYKVVVIERKQPRHSQDNVEPKE